MSTKHPEDSHDLSPKVLPPFPTNETTVIPPEANRDKTGRKGHLPLAIGGGALAIVLAVGAFSFGRTTSAESPKPETSPEPVATATANPGETEPSAGETVSSTEYKPMYEDPRLSYEEARTPEPLNSDEQEIWESGDLAAINELVYDKLGLRTSYALTELSVLEGVGSSTPDVSYVTDDPEVVRYFAEATTKLDTDSETYDFVVCPPTFGPDANPFNICNPEKHQHETVLAPNPDNSVLMYIIHESDSDPVQTDIKNVEPFKFPMTVVQNADGALYWQSTSN